MHKTEELLWRQENNGQASVLIRCCDDDRTDHWHTVALLHPDPAEREANIQAIHEFVAAQHEAALQHRANRQKRLGVAGKIVEHPEDVLERWHSKQKK